LLPEYVLLLNTNSNTQNPKLGFTNWLWAYQWKSLLSMLLGGILNYIDPVEGSIAAQVVQSLTVFNDESSLGMDINSFISDYKDGNTQALGHDIGSIIIDGSQFIWDNMTPEEKGAAIIGGALYVTGDVLTAGAVSEITDVINSGFIVGSFAYSYSNWLDQWYQYYNGG
jgi:hypothetical protein